MSLPVRALIVALLFVAQCLTHQARSQTAAARNEANASVTGKVTINGKPAAGLVVGMRLGRPERTSPTFRATTNEDGIYRINNIASGNYRVAPVAPGMLISNAENPEEQILVISEGDNVEGIDFNLIRGGVITGKITDADGRPLIEAGVSLVPVEPQKQSVGDMVSGGMTDDRGIYRMFGIRPGRYKVLFSEARRQDPDRRRPPLLLTYYPDVTDPAKATVVDVEPGGEALNIDIKVGSSPQTFSASGRVVDSDTGNPVPNVTIQLERLVAPDSYHSEVDGRSDQRGQFRLANLPPGKYLLEVSGGEGSDLLPQGPTTFELADSDVTDLLAKTSRGAQVSGVVVFEGTRKEKMAGTYVYISVKGSNPANTLGGSMLAEPDGRFKSSWGLEPGVVSFSVLIDNRYLNLRRIERDGVVQPNAISIQKGEHISGLRLFVSYSNGSITGTVKIINGTLPPAARLMVQVHKPESQEPQYMAQSTQADARGHFLLDGLAPGNYELTVVAYVPDSRARPAMSKQTVTVTDGAATEVMVTLDLTPPVGP